MKGEYSNAYIINVNSGAKDVVITFRHETPVFPLTGEVNYSNPQIECFEVGKIVFTLDSVKGFSQTLNNVLADLEKTESNG